MPGQRCSKKKEIQKYIIILKVQNDFCILNSRLNDFGKIECVYGYFSLRVSIVDHHTSKRNA